MRLFAVSAYEIRDVIKYACLSDHLHVYLRGKYCEMCLLFLSVEQVLSEDKFSLSWFKSSGIKLSSSVELDFLMKS